MKLNRALENRSFEHWAIVSDAIFHTACVKERTGGMIYKHMHDHVGKTERIRVHCHSRGAHMAIYGKHLWRMIALDALQQREPADIEFPGDNGIIDRGTIHTSFSNLGYIPTTHPSIYAKM